MAVTSSPLLTVVAIIGTAKFNFLIDTGASVSIVPGILLDNIILKPSAVMISSATGQPIRVHGEAKLDLKIKKLRRIYSWNFVIADTTQPLLGMDFLSHFGLTINCNTQEICDTTTKIAMTISSINGEVENITINNLSQHPECVEKLLKKYSSLLTTQNTSIDPNKIRTYHRIDTGDNRPVYCKRRNLAPDRLEIAKAEFKNLMEQGIIRPSKSPWSSPLHMVPKKEPNKWRPCGDFRALNSITKPDRYPIPILRSVSSSLYNKQVYSKLDIVRAYHHILMHPSDVEKTATTTPFGLFEWISMPFGLRNSASTFQRYMDNLFLESKCTFVYIDDILVFSESRESHKNDLEEVLKILAENNLRISIEKCEFFKSEINFLGFTITSEGIRPTTEKSDTISNFPEPTSSQELRRFLGMAGYYRHILPNFAEVTLPLTNLIRDNPKSKNITLSNETKNSFVKVKEILSNAVVLYHPKPDNMSYQLVTDASQYAVGGALHQMIDGKPVPIGFFSKKLSIPQTKYSTFDRELLAAFLAVIHFKSMIEGRIVTLFTDHKPLKSAFLSQQPAKSDRQQRHISVLTEYLTAVEYVKGNDNIVADCLSRAVNAVNVDPFDLNALAEKQTNDEEIGNYRDKLKKFKINENLSIYCDVSLPYPRPFVTKNVRRAIFEHLHNISHSGIKSSLRIIKQRYFWPDMDRCIRKWCAECSACQESKIIRHTKAPVTSFLLPSERFTCVHIDIVGPLPPAKEVSEIYTKPYRYLLTCIDRSTRWLEAIPIAEITASAIASAFLAGWISRFGVPLHLVSDRGSQFESELFTELSRLIGFHRLRTTSYHPQTNGKIERAHKTIKTAITARKQGWLEALPVVLLGIRCTPNDTNYSPFTAVTGETLLVPQLIISDKNCEDFSGEQIRNLAKEMQRFNHERLKIVAKHHHQPSYIPSGLSTCTHVWIRVDRVRRPLEAPYTGPFKVKRRTDKFFVVETIAGSEDTVSIDRLKPAILPTELNEEIPQAESPPETEVLSSEEAPETQNDLTEDSAPAAELPEIIDRPGKRKINFRRNSDYHYY